VTVAAGADLISHVVVDGHTSIGAGARLFPFCTVGMAPQDLKYKGEPTRCELGARTQVREHVTIHRGTVTGTGLTRVGEDCLLMAGVHVAHDCAVGNGVVIANNVLMGGHVTIGDNAVIGGGAAIHQFTRVGRAAMIGGLSGVEADVIPFGTVIGNRAHLAGLNLVGLKRRGYDRAQIHAVRAAFRTMFRGEGVFAERVEEVRAQFGDEPLIVELLLFIDNPSRRGLIRSATEDADDDAG
jgi:UDP-N-acetylglucosamine acyltransferase